MSNLVQKGLLIFSFKFFRCWAMGAGEIKYFCRPLGEGSAVTSWTVAESISVGDADNVSSRYWGGGTLDWVEGRSLSHRALARSEDSLRQSRCTSPVWRRVETEYHWGATGLGSRRLWSPWLEEIKFSTPSGFPGSAFVDAIPLSVCWPPVCAPISRLCSDTGIYSPFSHGALFFWLWIPFALVLNLSAPLCTGSLWKDKCLLPQQPQHWPGSLGDCVLRGWVLTTTFSLSSGPTGQGQTMVPSDGWWAVKAAAHTDLSVWVEIAIDPLGQHNLQYQLLLALLSSLTSPLLSVLDVTRRVASAHWAADTNSGLLRMKAIRLKSFLEQLRLPFLSYYTT